MYKKYIVIIVLFVLYAAACTVFSKQLGEQRGLILTLLTPELQKASDDFYSEYLSDSPSVTYYSAKIMTLKKTEHGYDVKIGVKPYVGPHFPVGYDEVQYFIDNIGNVTLTDFSHKRNYEIPERLGVTIKKPIPVS